MQKRNKKIKFIKPILINYHGLEKENGIQLKTLRAYASRLIEIAKHITLNGQLLRLSKVKE